MATHRVKFEPVGIEMDCDESETVLNAAFRQGYMLMHGCKEGQCSACKSFLLDGEVDLEKYSTFALPDFERDEGYVLLCRTHVYSDATIELINYDEEILRSANPIVEATTEVVAVEPLTHDIRRLVLKLRKPERIKFSAGQYVDVRIPGSDEHRAFSMANTPANAEQLEFIIKAYPGGRFSSLLDGKLKPGDLLEVKGPYGTCTLRQSHESDLVLIGGGAGMAPLWSLLNTVAESGSARKVTFYYGARSERDLLYLGELKALEERMPGFRCVLALSDAGSEDGWSGEKGFISDVCDRLHADLSDSDCYVCGPPPMVDAALALLERRGVATHRIFFDKFTITASADERTPV